MAYATPAQILAELAGHDDLDLPADLEPLIAAASRAVDRRLGPLLVDATSGLKLDPILLTAAQRGALARAVAVAVGNLAQLDAEEAFGGLDFLPENMRALRGPSLDALLDAELAGLGLLQRSGCALPDPLDDLIA